MSCRERQEGIARVTQGVLIAVVQVIDAQGLVVREDRVLHTDVCLRESVTALLLNYEPRWLQLGLETVVGELVPAKPAKAAATAPLRKFIIEVSDF